MKKWWIILLIIIGVLLIAAVISAVFMKRRHYFEPMDGPGMVYKLIADEIEYTETNQRTGGTYRLYAVRSGTDVHILSERRLDADAELSILETDADVKLLDGIGDILLEAGMERAGVYPEMEPRRFQPVESKLTVTEPYRTFTVTSRMDLSEQETDAWNRVTELLEAELKEQRYPVEYFTDISYLKNAKETYPAGANVVVYYDLIATDTDYTFLLDGESIPYDYDDRKGFVISFVMPSHAVKLEEITKNSMEYIPDMVEEETEIEKNLIMLIGETEVTVEWEDNASVDALRAMALPGPMIIDMSMYGGFEQVGNLGEDLPREDKQTTTQAGDIVLYAGDQIVVFYGSNSWAYTRLGRITDRTPEQLKDLLGNGNVTITLIMR